MAELAISNIAWTNEEEPTIAAELQRLGVGKIELAPTKYWDDPTQVAPEQVQEKVDWWKGHGIEVVAFQSMLFARPDLKIFAQEGLRQETYEYMSEFLRLAGDMGATRLVFGSPKNRQRGELEKVDADKMAQQFFSSLGDVALRYNAVLCIEPNAPQYNCDYITTAAEGAALVEQVNSPGIGLHLDTACMTLAGDDMGEAIRRYGHLLQHFHVSAPMLDRVYDRDEIDYRAAAEALRDIDYDGVISIEMRPGDKGENMARVEEAIQFVKRVFPID